jgi:prepilin-type N-terminal cleavage/methylation domain-containing protein
MKNKGFTLIELIAVIVILGMLLMIVIPATGRLIASNDKQVYDQYYSLVKEAAYKYARGESYDLGGVSNNGCIKVDTLDQFIELGLLKSFTVNDEDVECYLPSELRRYTNVKESDINNLQDGKPASDFYDIRIKNNKGKYTIEHSLVCVRDNKTIVYKKLVEDDKIACNKYVPTDVNILYSYITTGSGKIMRDSGSNNTLFVNTAFKDNNYVRYSGKLWRIVSVNTSDKTIKLVSDEVVSYYNYDETASPKYRDSNIEQWMEQEFKKTLRIPSIYLKDASWSYAPLNNGNNPPAQTAETEVQSTVGLLNLYEVTQAGETLGTTTSPWYTITPSTDNKIWNISTTNTASKIDTSKSSGIRPAIVLRPGVAFQTGGNGSKSNPFQIIGEQSGLIGEKLSSRFVGEYVTFDSKTYRIISISDQGIKLMSKDYSLSGIFDNSNIYQFGGISKISTNMQSNYYDRLADKTMLEEFEFCTDFATGTTQYVGTCSNTAKRNGYFTAPKVGDMYVAPNGEDYWTISPSKAETDPISGEIKDPEVNLMTATGMSSAGIRTNGSYYPVIMISKDVKITGGNGRYPNIENGDTPYTIALN